MGILLVIVMMAYSAGLCHLLNRFAMRSSPPPTLEPEWDQREVSTMVPDRVPAEWVDAYRAEHGG